MKTKEEMDVAFENCLTYLRRRGRLPFRAASFGPVDNLILSLCAYDPFEWVLPGVESGVWLPFSQAVEKLTQRPGSAPWPWGAWRRWRTRTRSLRP